MSSQPNRLKPTTTALAMLRRGWTITTPDGKYNIEPGLARIGIVIKVGGYIISDYPLTPNGFERMMNEIINPPF